MVQVINHKKNLKKKKITTKKKNKHKKNKPTNKKGKTTTINLLTGLLQPSKDNAWILEHNILNQMSEIRKNIGVGLQYAVLSFFFFFAIK